LETFRSFESKIYSVNETSFTDIALEIFRFQANNNFIYKSFIKGCGISIDDVKSLEHIPYLPISFFKSHLIKTGDWQHQAIFSSSGTTNKERSKHLIADVQFYEKHARKCFEHFFGALTNYHFLALLPSYLERNDSSLVAMMDYFIRESDSAISAFYLYDVDRLLTTLNQVQNDSRKCILWGVSFALLDLAERFPGDLSHCLVVETGGMKGRRREMTRNEMQDVLNAKINVKTLFSEYGMTELLSQAYSTTGDSRFFCPPWMRIIGRDITDPFKKGLLSETAGINVVDLANWHTLSFIETEDLGRIYKDGSFEVLGRLDNSDLRGCNLMIQ
jgi:phenylacetate-coenzyme A ligase PaaK-like adenylate-forming protein